MSSFRTRSAPSPTGYLHLGTARTILFTKLFATKYEDGIYYLRLEDTDRNRLNPEAAINLIGNLHTLGLDPDEGVSLNKHGKKNDFYGIYQNGDLGPYIQSERLEHYHEYAQLMIDKGLAYWSYLTPEEKQELQEIKKSIKRPIDYYKICVEKYIPDDLYKSVKNALKDPNKPALMYKLHRNLKVACHDLLVDSTIFDLSLEEDFVILRPDGYPLYHLAHIVDDYLMKTTLVVRSQEWYPSFPKHKTMFLDCFEHGILSSEVTDWVHNCPQYIHLPFILGETGNKKMSKRDGNVNMQDYLDKGYMPEAIINYLAFLGWNPGTEKEIYLEKYDFENLNQDQRLAKLIHNISLEFNYEKLSKSPARFNLEKLNWFNREYIKLISDKEWFEIGKVKLGLVNIEDVTTQLALILDKNRVTTTSEFGSDSDCILKWSKPTNDEIKWKKISIEESKQNLKEISDWLLNNDGLLSFISSKSIENHIENTSNLETTMKAWLMANQKDTGSYLWPLRVALSGKQKSPSPFELLSILSKDEISKRVKVVLEN
ncbi:MAG: glutamate--tRNA ligase [candidate division SR1 bacterium]|nr:glutamate--tRNA ligase [candidate division SR1 bacterium]